MYFTWAQGFRHGGANAVPHTGPFAESPELDVYDADSAANWEIGIKGSYTRALNYTLSAFLINIEDTQVDSFSPAGAFPIVVNGGKAQSRGIELALDGQLTDNTAYTFGYNYTVAEWKESGIANAVVPYRKGDKLPGVPQHMATASVDHFKPLSNGNELVLHLDAFYRAKVNNTLNNLNPAAIFEVHDAFAIVNASVGLTTGTWAYRVYVKNLFNEEGTTGSSPNDGLWAYKFITRPRTIGVNIDYKFN